ncbi:MAG TPA: cupredoxin domain-containing protein [Candidatus Limnocylindria bacterium]|nr:cupredoxin domain-containing protein [Candidatus Limnocylindria bacterium]
MTSLIQTHGPRAGLLALAIVASACGAGEPTSMTTSPTAEESAETTASAAPTLAARFEEVEPFADPPEGAVEILMTFGPTFVPEEATATAGTVTFFLKNDKGDGPPAAHNFLLGTAVDAPPLASSPLMGSGEAGVLTIEDLGPGTYAYWCTIPSPDGQPHSHYGMVGTLTVTP